MLTTKLQANLLGLLLSSACGITRLFLVYRSREVEAAAACLYNVYKAKLPVTSHFGDPYRTLIWDFFFNIIFVTMNVVSRLESFFQLNHQVDISFSLTKATAL